MTRILTFAPKIQPVRPLIILILLFLNLIDLNAQGKQPAQYLSNPEVNRLFYSGFRHLYDFEFRSCEENAGILKRRFPESPWGFVLQAEYHWWMIITGDTKPEHGTKIGEELEIALIKAATLPDQEGIFCKIIVYSLSSRYALYKGRYISVLEQLTKAAGLIRSGKKDVETYEPFKLTQGLFDYFMAEAGSRFGIFNPLSLFGINADKKRGLQYLQQCTLSQDEILRTESRYFLMKIYAELEHEPTISCRYGSPLHQAYPDNLIFRWHCRVCKNEGQARNPVQYTGQLNEAQRQHFQKLFLQQANKN